MLGLFGGALWLLFGPTEVTEYNFSAKYIELPFQMLYSLQISNQVSMQ